MDVSKQFIKMSDCPEIQDKWFIKDGDWVGSEHGVVSINHINEANEYYSSIKFRLIREDNIWLPRQDQIQEMLKAHYQKHLKILYDFSLTVSWYINSLEQLWLAFYMYEKHSKIWSSKEEKWVKK